MAARKSTKQPHRRNTIAWIALFVALLALAVALSSNPMVQRLGTKLKENWPILREEISRFRERQRAEEETDAATQLQAASRAVNEGDEEEAQEHLGDALSRIRSQIRDLRGSARSRLIELRDDVQDLADSLEMGSESARQLSSFASRMEEFVSQGDSASEEE